MKKGFLLSALACAICIATCVSGLAAEGQPEKIRVAISSISTSQVNIWVPLAAGLFKKYGLDVRTGLYQRRTRRHRGVDVRRSRHQPRRGRGFD